MLRNVHISYGQKICFSPSYMDLLAASSMLELPIAMQSCTKALGLLRQAGAAGTAFQKAAVCRQH